MPKISGSNDKKVTKPKAAAHKKTATRSSTDKIETTQTAPSSAIGDEVDTFIKHIDSLQVSFPLTDAILGLVHQKSRDDYVKFLNKHYKKEIDSGDDSFPIEPHHAMSFAKLSKQVESGSISRKIVPRSLLVALVSQFDSFLGRLLRVLFILRPELLNMSDKSITFSQLVEFGSVENATEYIIEKEIETVLRKSHAEQFVWLESKFATPLRQDLPAWKPFIELTERRNLFVHANGIVSGQYLKVCREHGVNIQDDISIGSELNVSLDYFKSAYRIIFELGFKLAHVLWRKQHPQDMLDADRNLNNVTYTLIREGKYHLAIVLLDFATMTLKKHFDDEQRRILIVNRAQAYKWLGDNPKTREIIDAEDWSATGNGFKLAEAVLKDDFARAAKIMKQIGSDGFPSKSDYGDWPLFNEFRKSSEFLKTFKDVFGCKFEMTVNEEEVATISLVAGRKPMENSSIQSSRARKPKPVSH